MRKTMVELCNAYGWPVSLACAGACIQCLRGEWRGWKNLLISNAMAAFSAIVCMSILPYYVPHDVAAGIAGIVGYSGATLIDAVIDRLKSEIETRNEGK